MEKACEFCGAPRPAVYCHADAAFLCLSCDAKVHSANALSGRHARDLLCDSCRENMAYVRCLDHSMLLCQECESRMHDVFSLHKKLLLKSFTGCPSAKHFANLWGFNESEQAQLAAHSDQFGSQSCVTTGHGLEPGIGSSSQQHKENQQEGQKNGLIVQQILDLKRLQLAEGDNHYSTTLNSLRRLDEGMGRQPQELESLTIGLKNFKNSNPTLECGSFPSAISQLDELSCSSSVGDSYLQYKSPPVGSQFWSQNLQDLGVCEDLGRFDDFDMPDVDLSFRNFEDLFTNEVHPLLDVHDPRWFDIEKEVKIGESVNNRMKTEKDLSAASAISINNDVEYKNEALQSDHIAHRLSKSLEHSPHLIRSSHSASVCRSLLSAENPGSDILDSGHSGKFTEHRGRSSTMNSKERLKSRLHGKQSSLAPCKVKLMRVRGSKAGL